MKRSKIFYTFLCFLCISLCGLFADVSYAKKKDTPPGVMPASPAETPEDVVWNYEKNAINLYISSAENLNFVNDQSHTVSLCLYQSPNMTELQSLAQTEEGLKELLQCKSLPPERLQATQIYVQPNSTLEKKLSRAENAQYIAVVAGFNELSMENCFGIFPFPIQTKKVRTKLVLWKTMYLAGKIDLRIDLSSESVNIQGVEHVQK